MSEQPSPPPAPQAATAAPADAPAVQKPDEAQTSPDVLAQPSAAAAPDSSTTGTTEAALSRGRQQDMVARLAPVSAATGLRKLTIAEKAATQADTVHTTSQLCKTVVSTLPVSPSAHGVPSPSISQACMPLRSRMSKHFKFSCLGIS